MTGVSFPPPNRLNAKNINSHTKKNKEEDPKKLNKIYNSKVRKIENTHPNQEETQIEGSSILT